MNRTWLRGCLVLAVLGTVCGSATSAPAQWGYPVYAYSPVTYPPVVVAPIVIAPRPYVGPYVVFSGPVVHPAPVVYGGYGPSHVGFGGYGYDGYGYGGYGFGGYAYGAGPVLVRERFNHGLFGHPNYHQHAHGPGFGHYHSHYRGW